MHAREFQWLETRFEQRSKIARKKIYWCLLPLSWSYIVISSVGGLIFCNEIVTRCGFRFEFNSLLFLFGKIPARWWSQICSGNWYSLIMFRYFISNVFTRETVGTMLQLPMLNNSVFVKQTSGAWKSSYSEIRRRTTFVMVSVQSPLEKWNTMFHLYFDMGNKFFSTVTISYTYLLFLSIRISYFYLWSLSIEATFIRTFEKSVANI